MTRDDADELARRIAKSWRGGPAYTEWVRYFIGHNYDPEIADAVLDQLHEVEPLTPAVFGAKYRALAYTATVAPHTEPAPGPRLSRDEVRAVLLAHAPRHLVTKEQP